MAEDNKDQEKTEQATSKRKQEAREKGQVAKQGAGIGCRSWGMPYLFLFWRVFHDKQAHGADEDVFP